MPEESEAKRWGIITSFRDQLGEVIEAPQTTVRQLLREMKSASMGPRSRGPIVIVRGERPRLDDDAHIVTEGEEILATRGRVPARIPLGYHVIERKGVTQGLIVCPPSCYRPKRMDEFGWTVQVSSLRSSRSWGGGDFEDLRTLAKRLVRGGAGAIAVNPLTAPLPLIPQQPSPYSPSTRAFIDPIYLALDKLPERVDLSDLRERGSRLASRRRLDRDAVYRLKIKAAERAFKARRGDKPLEEYRNSWGGALESYARFCARTENHSWPESERSLFHMWLQMRLDEQLTRVAQDAPLIFDLPVGVDPNGAEAWELQQQIVPGVSIGAPPDAFNPAGQVWGLAAFNPWALRASGYKMFIRLIRRWMALGSGIRIDHILGLFRQFWVPEGQEADQGAYVRFPWRDLFRIMALESVRNEAIVIGEDLGTVESRVRREMATHKVFGQRLMLFDGGHRGPYGRWAMASITNHDLPTVAGLWSGHDIRVQHREGIELPAEEFEKVKRRLATLAGIEPSSGASEASIALHRALARSNYALRIATIEDALGVKERVNLPGTLRADNWRLPLPVPVEKIGNTKIFKETERALRGD